MRTRGHIRNLALGALAGIIVAACLDAPAPLGERGGAGTQPGRTAPAACRVSHVVDGDTVILACAGQRPQRARLMGFDTPEVHSPRCRAELALGNAATREMRRLAFSTAPADFSFHGHDRYGRALVRMRIGGTDVAQMMISRGLAVPYAGHRRINWCERLARK